METIQIILAIFVLSGLALLFFRRRNKPALIVIDMQNDFCPGGSLGVTDGDKIISIINRWIRQFIGNEKLVVLTRDWHPNETRHFKCAENPNGWEVHGVANTLGACFHKDLIVPDGDCILSKGMGQEDAYSAFDNSARIHGMDLDTFLVKKRVRTLFVCGLATDYCVKETVMDALGLGYEVFLLVDAMKAVSGDGQTAIDEMVANGAKVYRDSN